MGLCGRAIRRQWSAGYHFRAIFFHIIRWALILLDWIMCPPRPPRDTCSYLGSHPTKIWSACSILTSGKSFTTCPVQEKARASHPFRSPLCRSCQLGRRFSREHSFSHPFSSLRSHSLVGLGCLPWDSTSLCPPRMGPLTAGPGMGR